MNESGIATFQLVAGTKVCDFVLSNNEVDFIQGDLGSGKTRGMCARIMRHAQQQRVSKISGLRLSRWAMVRNSYPDLKRTTIRTWLEMFPEHVYGKLNWGQPPYHRIRFADVLLEVDFLALDKPEDVRKLRSGEYTGIANNELPFIPKDIFDEETSRLRYPGEEHGGSEWHGVISDGNAPDEDHWFAIMSGQVPLPENLSEEEKAEYKWPANWKLFMQPPAMLEKRNAQGAVIGYEVNPHAENLHNLPPNYYEKMIVGKSKAWIDSRCRNTVALVVEGSPVWPMFRREAHVAAEALRPVEGHEVVVGMDFGRQPAAVFMQPVNNRVLVQYELLGKNEGSDIFAPKVKRFLTEHYPGFRVRFYGDPKGQDKGQAVERTSYDIFAAHGMKVLPAPVRQNNIEMRVETVSHLMNEMHDGRPRLAISPLCRTLIVACAGRYHLEREEDGVLRPKKDRYSNPADAFQYGCLGLGEGRRLIGLDAGHAPRAARVYTGRKTMRRIVA